MPLPPWTKARMCSTRGGWFSRENIEERLTMREMMSQLRSAGIDTGGPPPYSARDSNAFARQLDRFLARHCKPPGGAV